MYRFRRFSRLSLYASCKGNSNNIHASCCCWCCCTTKAVGNQPCANEIEGVFFASSGFVWVWYRPKPWDLNASLQLQGRCVIQAETRHAISEFIIFFKQSVDACISIMTLFAPHLPMMPRVGWLVFISMQYHTYPDHSCVATAGHTAYFFFISCVT